MTSKVEATMTDDVVERIARAILAADESDQDLLHLSGQPENVATALAEVAYSIMTEEVERAWREGWATCKASVSDDEQVCLTTDVEQDAWLDRGTRAALAPAKEGR